MLNLVEKTQAFIESIPWYIYAVFMILGLYNIFQYSENSLAVIGNVIAIACMIYVVFHNWENNIRVS